MGWCESNGESNDFKSADDSFGSIQAAVVMRGSNYGFDSRRFGLHP